MLGLRESIASLLVVLWFIYILLTIRGQELARFEITISVANAFIIIIATSTVASSVIAPAAAAIYSAASQIFCITIVAASTVVSATFYVESASAMNLSSWTLAISYVINLLPALAV